MVKKLCGLVVVVTVAMGTGSLPAAAATSGTTVASAPSSLCRFLPSWCK